MKTWEDQLEQLSFDLRHGLIDDLLVTFIEEVWDWYEDVPSSLLRYLERHRPGIVRLLASLLWRCLRGRLRISPNRRIFDLLTRLVLEEQLFAYSSRFLRYYPEEIALACERFQTNIFAPRVWLLEPKPQGLRLGDKLNLFRLAQSIRNEHGVKREGPIPISFESYENIVTLERKIENNDPVPFMIDCNAIEKIDRGTIECMYKSTWTYSQLETFHDAVTGDDCQIAGRLYAIGFKSVTERRGDLTPTWREVKKYLKTASPIDCRPQRVFGANILDEELNEALNCVLNCLAESSPAYLFSERGDALIGTALRFLKRGAKMLFKAPDEKRSSLLALVSSCDGVKPHRLLSKFLPYICCPLKYEGPMVVFDVVRPVPLYCIAARNISSTTNSIALPLELRPKLEAHRELLLYFETRTPLCKWLSSRSERPKPEF